MSVWQMASQLNLPALCGDQKPSLALLRKFDDHRTSIRLPAIEFGLIAERNLD